MPEELLLTDMTCARPSEAWTDADPNVFCPVSEPRRDCWRAIDYKTELFSGRLLTTVSRDAPALTIPLNRQGWHALSIGIAGRYGAPGRIEVRLTGETRWQLFRSDPDVAKVWRKDAFLRTLSEEPWRFADLTGRDLEVRCPPDMAEMQLTGIWSVRGRPVAPADLPAVQSKRHRPMVYLNDGDGIFAGAKEPGPHIVADALAPFKDSDWDICCFGTGAADLVNYPSRAGTLTGNIGGWHFYRKGDANHGKILRAMIDDGQDPLRQAVDLAHEHGHRCWIYLRPQGWAFDLIYEHAFRSPFFSAHPEWRCMLRDGRGLAMMSIAYDGVRHHLNVILREALDRGADGLCIAFIRGFPLVRYEQPVLDRYRELYGGDAREVADADEGLRSVWREFVTSWMREVRKMLDDAGPQANGKRRELAAFVGAYPEWDAQYGIDVAAWAKEGLLDAVLLYPHGLEHPVSPIPTEKTRVDLYVEALRGTGVPVIPSLGSWTDRKISAAAYRQRAHAFYRAGAAGLTRWDTDTWLANVGLDDAEINALWCEKYMPPQENVITELAGVVIDRFPPGIAG